MRGKDKIAVMCEQYSKEIIIAAAMQAMIKLMQAGEINISLAISLAKGDYQNLAFNLLEDTLDKMAVDLEAIIAGKVKP